MHKRLEHLILITNHFPFGKGETFIDSEFKYLYDNFDKIIIVSLDATSTITRAIPDNVVLKRYNPTSSFSDYLKIPNLVFKNLHQIIKLYDDEIEFRKRIDNRINTARLLFLLKRILKTLELKNYIIDVLNSHNIKKNIIFYSYWLKTGAHAISLLNYPDSIKISRAHRIDLYEEDTAQRYLPLLKTCIENLDAIYFISENGKKYFEQKTGFTTDKFKISYLGVKNYFNIDLQEHEGNFVFVSCSSMIPVKRIDRIIYSLGLIKTNKKILWMHFGEGLLMSKLKDIADTILTGTNITYRFMGHYSNKALLEFYARNRIDLFINTSMSEGLPVSMMEAQSAGIPIIATNVGGVSELVVDGTGFLIEPRFEPIQYAHLIEHFLNLPENEIQVIRNKAYNNWKSRFNADKNFSEFVEDINAIFASKTTNSLDETGPGSI